MQIAPPPLRWRRAHAVFLGALALLFLLGIGFELHGYSISMWREIIDGSEPDEILAGKARLIRGDDWFITLPLALSQRSHEPAFPRVNENIGFGMPMLVPFPLPVAHPLTLLRPATWGFFVGSDIGLAWLWWGRLLGLFGAAAFVLLAISGDRLRLAVPGAALLTASPFFLFWGLRPVPSAVSAILTFLAGLALVFARRPAAILVSGLALGVAAASFMLALYPPFQVPLALLFAALAAALVWEHRAALDFRHLPLVRGIALLGGLLILAGSVGLLFADAGEAIAALRESEYPGRRAPGGVTRVAGELLGANLWLALRTEEWGSLENICEAAGFWLLSPVLLAAALTSARSRIGPVEMVLAAAVFGFGLHAVVGLPEALGRTFPLLDPPPRRTMIAFGIAEVALLVRLLARRDIGRPTNLFLAAVIAFGWAALVAFAAWQLNAPVTGAAFGPGVALAAVNGALAFLALRTRFVWSPIALAALGSLVASAWFNPVVRGGTGYLYENPLSRRIVALDRAHDRDSTWLVFGNLQLPNLLRILGVHALNGVHPVPRPELWARLDSSGLMRRVYDRFAHVGFAVAPGSRPRLRAVGEDLVMVGLWPSPAMLSALGVTHVLVWSEERADLEPYEDLVELGAVGNTQLYAVPDVREPDGVAGKGGSP